jgi:hypothetical protein
MVVSTIKLLIEPRKLVTMETTMITMDVQALAKSNVEMVLLLDPKSAIWEQIMAMPPTNVNSTPDSQDAVMDMLTLMKSATMLLQDHLLPLAETTANSHIVVMELSTLFSERNVMLETTTMILQALDAQLVAPKTLVDIIAHLQMVTSTEPLPVQDVSMVILDHQQDLLAQDLSNGWLLNQSKRFLNCKLNNSNTYLELESEEANVEIVNLLIPILNETANASLKPEMLQPLPELLVLPFPENPHFKLLSTFSLPTLLKHQFFNKLLPPSSLY